jgi:curved DNA-binding protein CbpA
MVKRAYRRLAKARHPDLGGDPQAFHRLEAAYRLLMD